MSGLTKDQLKNKLITHGVELPPSSAKKDEYVRLYDKYVAPMEQSKGDFSSDDDEDSPIVPIQNEINMEQSLVIDGLDISKLDDNELFSRLQDLGATVGPIVDTTRKVYQKKLLVLMGGDVVDSPTYNGDVDEDEYSDSEEAEEGNVEEPVQTRSSFAHSNTTSPAPTQTTEIRKRILISSAGGNTNDDVVFDPDRHTPSPRRSLRSVTSTMSSSETITVRKHVNNGRSGFINTSNTEAMTEEEDEHDRSSKISLLVRLLVKILFLGLIVALIMYIYQNDSSESPFKAVEQLARQALEAAVGDDASVKEGDSVEAAAPVKPPAPKAVPAQ